MIRYISRKAERMRRSRKGRIKDMTAWTQNNSLISESHKSPLENNFGWGYNAVRSYKVKYTREYVVLSGIRKE